MVTLFLFPKERRQRKIYKKGFTQNVFLLFGNLQEIEFVRGGKKD